MLHPANVPPVDPADHGNVVAGWVFIGVGIALTGLVGLLLWLYRIAERQRADSLNWPWVYGTIQQSEVLRRKTRWIFRRRVRYSAHVTYQYEVNGRVLSNNQIRLFPADLDTGKRAAHKVVADFPRGVNVPVYYDPADPTRTMVIRGRAAPGTYYSSRFALGLLVVGAVAFLVGGVFLVMR